jgi:hypothetical protein
MLTGQHARDVSLLYELVKEFGAAVTPVEVIEETEVSRRIVAINAAGFGRRHRIAHRVQT